MNWRPFAVVLLLLPITALLSLATASSAANSMAGSNVGRIQRIVAANDLKPAACAARNLATIVQGSGTINGTTGNDLIIGSSGMDLISGMGGDDCILGGGGADTLIGGDGDDTCIGGPGADVLNVTCEQSIP